MKITIEICEEWHEIKKESGLSWRYILKKGITEIQK